jgi:hypothetical protein
MRSEIPQIEVITAVGDADLEDYVSQLLFTQGWSIIFRAFDTRALEEFIQKRSTDLRTIIVYTSELPGFTTDLIMKHSTTTTTFICLDGIPNTAHEIMQKVRGQLRLPLVHSSAPMISASHMTPKIQESLQKVIVITGSSGAPGITLLATALATEISKSRKVLFIDADFRNIPLGQYYTSNDFSIQSLTPHEKPTTIPESDPKEVIIIDVGVLPPLGEVVNDRRWLSLLHNNFFDVATALVYVSQTTKPSLMQLDQFMKEFPILMKRLSPTYVCINKGQSKELRQAQSAFAHLVAGEKQYQLAQSLLYPAGTSILDSLFTPRSRSKKEIGSIAASLL